MCEFRSLYYNDDGYVVQCKDCGYYQLAYGNVMLSLSGEDFRKLRSIVKMKQTGVDFAASENTRNVIVPTPSPNQYFLLTQEESSRLHEILEAADNEEKAQELIALFHS